MGLQRFAAGFERRLPRTVGFFQSWLRRFFEIEGVERSIALASLAFTALFPLLIIYASVAPQVNGQNFVDGLIARFDLSGPAATSLEQAFAPPDEVQSSVTIVSVLFVIVSALSFTRAFQRTYERSWQLDKLGLRGTKFGLCWLGAMVLAYSARPITGVRFGRPVLDATIALSVSAAIWLVTPYLLLSRRLPWRRLIPSAILTAVLMTCVGVASLIYVPNSVESSADRFGVIGVAFALLGWLVATGFTVTIAATGGAVLTETIEEHSRGRVAAYLALERVRADAAGEGDEEDGSEDR